MTETISAGSLDQNWLGAIHFVDKKSTIAGSTLMSYEDFRIFATVVDHGGFASAATTLRLTRSAVSRRIERFEKRLGVRLLDRTTRSVSLTDAGEAIYERSLRIISEVAEAELLASDYRGEPHGNLKVTCPIMIGLHLLTPILQGYLRRYPQVKIQLDLADDEVDSALVEHDVAIRWGEQQDSALTITRLSESRQIVCATPTYIERHGAPQTPRDLLNHNCLMMSRLGVHSNEWTFLENGRPLSIKVGGNFVVNGGHGNFHALLASLGVARVTDLSVANELRSGELVRLLEAFEPEVRVPIHAVYKGGRLLPPKIRTFVSHVRQNLRVPDL